MASSLLVLLALEASHAFAFSTSRKIHGLEVQQRQPAKSHPPSYAAPSPALAFLHRYRSLVVLSHAPVSPTASPPTGFIDTELRGAAMRLHTRMQAPQEGQAEATQEEEAKEPYVPTHADYLQFLVDSQHVYRALEEIVGEHEALAAFRQTGLERTKGLERDISFLMKEYRLERPPVGAFGTKYATLLREMAARTSTTGSSSSGGDDDQDEASFVPEFMCHFYNFYFAHTAGGRMIGKKMSSLLLNKQTLEFYKVSTVVIRFVIVFACFDVDGGVRRVFSCLSRLICSAR